jgi:hypothetical protein
LKERAIAPIAAGDPPRCRGHAPHRHHDRAADVDGVEGVEQDRQQDADDREDHRAVHVGVSGVPASARIGAQSGQDRGELRAQVVDVPLALAGRDEPPGARRRAPFRGDDPVDPARHVRLDVADERVEQRALVGLCELLARAALLLGQRPAGRVGRLEEPRVSGDHEAAHPGLGVDHGLLEAGNALHAGDGPVRAVVRAVGGAHRADEQGEHGEVEQPEHDPPDRELAGQGPGLPRGRAHRGRS